MRQLVHSRQPPDPLVPIGCSTRTNDDKFCRHEYPHEVEENLKRWPSWRSEEAPRPGREDQGVPCSNSESANKEILVSAQMRRQVEGRGEDRRCTGSHVVMILAGSTKSLCGNEVVWGIRDDSAVLFGENCGQKAAAGVEKQFYSPDAGRVYSGSRGKKRKI